MKASARNHFEGTIAGVREGAIDDEITLAVGDGVEVVATVTRDSREALGLAARCEGVRPRQGVVDHPRHRGRRCPPVGPQPARRHGRALTPGAIHTEVVLEVPGSADVVAVITNDSAARLALVRGSAATAIFKASSVVVGVR